MRVFELTVPGVWLQSDDRGWSHKITSRLHVLRSLFFSANVAANLFETSMVEVPYDAGAFRARRKAERERHAEYMSRVETKNGTVQTEEAWLANHLEAETQLKRDKWAEGSGPSEFDAALPFIYAQSFLSTLDGFDRLLAVLVEEPGVPEGLKSIHGRIAVEFPDLREVRNSAQHLEDRIRGFGPYDKKISAKTVIEAKPVDNGAIKAEGSATFLNCLSGSKFGSIMVGGHYGEVDVSQESMSRLQNIMQAVLDCFEWHGPKQHWPD